MSRYLNARYQPMAAYVPGEQPATPGLVKLNTNESPFPPAPGAIDAVSPTALRKLRLYSPIGVTALDRAIAQAYRVSTDQVVVGNGSDEVLSFIFLAYGDHGVRFADTTYGFYKVWASLYGVKSGVVPVMPDLRVNPADYRQNDAMVVLANPNAPTGLALSLDEIESIVRANPDHPVVIDEAYIDFGGESAVELISRYENLLVVMTFSKSRNLAGARLGFALGSPALIADLNKIRYSINPYNVNALTQWIGAASIRDPAYFEACTRAIMAARTYTSEALCALGFDVIPSKANFVFASPPGGDGGAYQRALREKNILVRHFDEERTRGYVRISIGHMNEMQRLIEATKEVLA